MKLKKQLYGIYAKHTKQSLQVIGECPARTPAASFLLANTHLAGLVLSRGLSTSARGTLRAGPSSVLASVGRGPASLAAAHWTPDVSQCPLGGRITPQWRSPVLKRPIRRIFMKTSLKQVRGLNAVLSKDYSKWLRNRRQSALHL